MRRGRVGRGFGLALWAARLLCMGAAAGAGAGAATGVRSAEAKAAASSGKATAGSGKLAPKGKPTAKGKPAAASKGKPCKGKGCDSGKGKSGKGKGKGKGGKGDITPTPRDFESEEKLTSTLADPRFILELPSDLSARAEPTATAVGAPAGADGGVAPVAAAPAPGSTWSKVFEGGNPRQRVTITVVEATPPLVTPELGEVLGAEMKAWALALDAGAELLGSDVRPFRGGFAVLATARLPGAPGGFRWAVRASFGVEGARVDVVGESAAVEGKRNLEQVMRGVVLAAQVLKPAAVDVPPFAAAPATAPGLLVPRGLLGVPGKDSDGTFALRVALEPVGVCSLHVRWLKGVKLGVGADAKAALTSALPRGFTAMDARRVGTKGAIRAQLGSSDGQTRIAWFSPAQSGTREVWEQHGSASTALCATALDAAVGEPPANER
ncbi:MAG: hypothetical protein IT370_01905 [Deltaproteobacteria bacterium]|nr:hypothetical protein [Deltaproteobacteria bacterium]